MSRVAIPAQGRWHWLRRLPAPLISVPGVVLLVIGWIWLMVWLVVEGPGDHPLRDETLYLALVVGSSALVLLRGLRHSAERGVWILLAAAMLCSTLGDFVYAVTVAGRDVEEFPSWADAFYLAYYPLVIASVVTFVRHRAHSVPRVVWTDAITLALAVGSLVGALLIAPLSGTLSGDAFALFVGAAYPVGDTAILLLAVVGVVLVGPGRSVPLMLISASMVVLALADLWYLNLVASGAYLEGTWLDGLWPLGSLLLVLAAMVPPSRMQAATTDARGLIAVPGAALVAAALTLTVGTARAIPLLTILLALTALVGVLHRLNDTVRHTIDMIAAQRQAATDDLTGLLNRRGFAAEAERVLLDRMDSEKIAVLHADLDGFKAVNDSLGHDIGDLVLRSVAERLVAVLAPAGGVVGRLGGDEFAVLLPGATAEVVATQAARIERVFSSPFDAGGLPVSLGVSVGMAVAPADGRDLSMLLRRADIAMYRAKTSGGGHAFFDAHVDTADEDHLRSVAELRRGMDAGELRLWFQPRISLATREVTGVEALMRWERADVGIVEPADFLPLAARAGIVGELTAFVLSEAVAQAARWRDAGMRLRVGVNLPATELSDPYLPTRLDHLLASHGLPGSALQVEFTEDSLLEDSQRARSALGALRSMGVRAAIDDYGTGFASLVQLHHLDVDEVKIDRRFVVPFLTDERSALIVKSTIELVHALGFAVVAVGIEEAEVADALTALGCDVAQGFHWTPPVPAAQFESWLSRHRTESGVRVPQVSRS